MRECGSCDVCCIVPEIDFEDSSPSFYKAPRTPCQYLDLSVNYHKCTIYENRPKSQCKGFYCSWMYGFGNEDNRPDKNGLLSFTSNINNGDWIIVVENKPNAVKKGNNLLIDLANQFDTALIIDSFETDTKSGDKVIIRNDLSHRASTMLGDFIGWIDDSCTIGLYELVNRGV